MPFFIDENGELFEGAAEDASEFAKQGLRIASPEDIAKHNELAPGIQQSRDAPLSTFAEKATSSLTALPGRIMQGAADMGLPPEATSLLFGVGGPMAVEQYSQLEGKDKGSPLYPGLLPADDRSAAKARLQGYEQDSPIASAVAGFAPDIAAAAVAAPAAIGTGIAGAVSAVGIEAMLAGNASEAVNAYVEDREFSAEAAMANVALDSLFGLGFMGAGYGAKRLMRALSKTKGAIEETAEVATKGIEDFKTDLLSRAKSRATEGVEPDAFLPAEVRSVAGNSVGAASEGSFDDVIEGAIKEIADGQADEVVIDLAQKEIQSGGAWSKHLAESAANRWDDANALGKQLTSAENKVEDFYEGAKLWTPDNVKAQDEVISDTIERSRKLLDDLDSLPDGEGMGIYQSRMSKDVERYVNRLQTARGVERNYLFDNFKRQMDKHVNDISRARNYEMPVIKDMQTRARAHADFLRGALEYEKAWGQNAIAQAAQNRAISSFMAPLKRIERQLFERLENEYGEVGAKAINVRARPDAIYGLMKKDPAFRGHIMSDLQQVLDGKADLAAVRDNYGFTKLDGLDAIDNAIQDVKAAFNNQSVIEHALKRYNDLGAPKPEGAPPGWGNMAADIAKSVAADAIGGGGAFTAGKVASHGFKMFKYIRNSQGKLVPRVAKPTENLGRVMSDSTRLIGKTGRLRIPSEWRLLPKEMRMSLQAHGFKEPLPGEYMPPVSAKEHGAVYQPPPPKPKPSPVEPTVNEPRTVAPDALKRGADSPDLSSDIPIGKASGAGAAALAVMGAGEADAAEMDHIPDMSRMATVEALNSIASGAQAQIDNISRSVVIGDAPIPESLREVYSSERTPTMQRFSEPGKEHDRLDEIESKLREFSADPVSFVDRFASGWGNVPATEPEVYSAMSAKGNEIASYLQSKLPQRTGKSLANPDGWPVSIDEIVSFAGELQGATSPMSVAQDMQYGEPAPEAIAAMKAMWPGVYMRMAMGAIAALDSLDEPPTDARLERIDRFFGLGSMLGAQFDSKAAGIVDAAAESAASEQPQAPPKRPLNMDAEARLAPSTRGGV